MSKNVKVSYDSIHAISLLLLDQLKQENRAEAAAGLTLTLIRLMSPKTLGVDDEMAFVQTVMSDIATFWDHAEGGEVHAPNTKLH